MLEKLIIQLTEHLDQLVGRIVLFRRDDQYFQHYVQQCFRHSTCLTLVGEHVQDGADLGAPVARNHDLFKHVVQFRLQLLQTRQLEMTYFLHLRV